MANDGAPICNLPNIGQVPALQPGRLFPAIPKAQDIPSLIQAVNALAQIVAQLVSPGLPPFRNNLAPYSAASRLVGTPGIVATAGSNGSAGAAGKDGKDGKEAKDPRWQESSRKTEAVKVKGTEDNEDAYLIMRRVTKLTITSNTDGKKKIEWSGILKGDNPLLLEGGPSELGQPIPIAGQSEGRPFVGTTKSDRETVEEDLAFPSRGVNGSGSAARPFEPGLMADCVGVSWAGGLAVEFFE